MLSYNQIIELNRQFATAHKILKNFGNGPRWKIVEHNQQATFKYPLMWMEDLPHPSSPGSFTTVFRVYFLDQVASLKKRGTDLMTTNDNVVKSDMEQCAQDLISFWAQDHDYPLLDVDKNITVTLIEDQLEDVVAGGYFDLKIIQSFTYNKCAIPMTGVTAPDSNEVTIIGNSVSMATVLAGSTYTFQIQNQDGDQTGTFDSLTKIWTVTTGSGVASQTLNGAAVVDQDSGTTKVITVKDTGGNNVGTKGTDTALALAVEIADCTTTVNGVSITNNKAETNKAITIRYANNDPVVVTTITDTEGVFIGEVPEFKINANAQLLFDAVGDVPEIVKPFFSNLIQGLEDSGVWANSNFWLICCVPSMNAFNTLIEIKSLTIQSSFYGLAAYSAPYNTAREAIPTFAGYGWRTSGNGYIRTGFIPSTNQTLNNSSVIIVTYSTEAAVSSFNFGALNSISQTNVFTTKLNTNALIGDAYSTTVGTGRISVASSDGVSGVYIVNRRSATYASIVKNSNVAGSIAGASGSLPSIEVFLNTYNNAGAPTTRRNQSPVCAWGSFGSGLTAAQEISISSIFSAWQIAMERKSGVETKQIILDGNSHTVYWFAKVMRTIEYNTIVSGWKYTNVGVSGQTITQMNADYASEVAPLYNAALTKNIILLYEGTNEMYVNGTTVDATITLIANYVTAAHATGYTVIVKKTFCRINPTTGPGLAGYPTVTLWNLAVDDFNTKLTTLLTGADAVSPVSSNHFIERASYGSDALYNSAVTALITNATNFYDTTHLTELGYKEEGDLDTIAINLI